MNADRRVQRRACNAPTHDIRLDKGSDRAHPVASTKGFPMTQQSVSAALERLEGLSAEFLEQRIAEVEKVQHVKIKDVAVALVPGGHGSSPAVTVVVTT